MTPDLIFDLGMNNGDDTDFYLAKGFKVVAVEANPLLCDHARTRFAAAVADGRLHVVNKAIAEHNGEIELFVDDSLTGSTTTVPEWRQARDLRKGSTSRLVRVPAVRFQSIIREYGIPYYLKADIQGNEYTVLEALLESADRPRYISVSSGSDVAGVGMTYIRRGFDLLARLGYTKFKVVQQNVAHLQKCPNPVHEGKYVDYRFKPGCSGLFGAELPGEWVSAETALREYRKLLFLHKFAPSNLSAFRFLLNMKSKSLRYHLDRLNWRGASWYDTHAMRG